MPERRVVVTGLGAVCSLGSSVDAIWRASRDGVAGIASATLSAGEHGPAPHTLPLARVAAGYEGAIHAALGPRALGGLDRFAAFAVAAAFEALEQAGLIGRTETLASAGIVLGHGMGGLDTLEKGYERFYGLRSPRLHPTTVPRVMVSAAASGTAMTFGVRGPVFATSSACASSAHAVAQGAGLIQTGLAEVCIVGGSEAIITPGCMRAWEGIQALSPTTCRPFSKERDGMAMGEGAGVLVIEEAEHARARGATVLAEYLGAGMSSDAAHLTQPVLYGPVAAMRKAAAHITKDGEEILIAAHGTGTPLNDKNEAAAIHEVFGASVKRHPVIATKSAHGHLIGGAAALQTIIGLCALRAGVAPPTLNYLGADPECDVRLITGAACEIGARRLLVNAFAFGGLNASLAFCLPDQAPAR